MGGWDPITPLRPHLRSGYRELAEKLQAAVDSRYALPAWTPESRLRHKEADRLAGASEAHYVAGWSRLAMQRDLYITLEPLTIDPLAAPFGMRPWQPWPPRLAQSRFLTRLEALLARAKVGRRTQDRGCGGGATRLAADARAH